jgi:uncharacterized protein
MGRKEGSMSGTLTVRGQGLASAQPDEVALQIELTALEQTPEGAFTEVATRSERLAMVLDELDVAAPNRSTTGAIVREEHEYQNDRRVHRGYRGISRVVVRLSDASNIGRLMKEAASAAQARFEGPWWKIAPENPARAEACRLAAADARRKAEAYAEALGVRLRAIEMVTEPGVSREPQRYRREPVHVLAMSAGPPELEVEAGELEVAAAVEVTFHLEERQG